MVIAVDGTSGSGKSSIAKRVAELTGFELLNTGKIYRKITKECLSKKIPPEDETRVTEVAKAIGSESLGDLDLHSEEISRVVPMYARIPSVRSEVRKIQQTLGTTRDIVVEGRDIGTIVFPSADCKFFITASLEERARRRQKQLGQTAENDFLSIMRNLEERDHQDEHRKASPLEIAPDAEMVDTTHLNLDQVVEIVMTKIKGKIA